MIAFLVASNFRSTFLANPGEISIVRAAHGHASLFATIVGTPWTVIRPASIIVDCHAILVTP